MRYSITPSPAPGQPRPGWPLTDAEPRRSWAPLSQVMAGSPGERESSPSHPSSMLDHPQLLLPASNSPARPVPGPAPPREGSESLCRFTGTTRLCPQLMGVNGHAGPWPHVEQPTPLNRGGKVSRHQSSEVQELPPRAGAGTSFAFQMMELHHIRTKPRGSGSSSTTGPAPGRSQNKTHQLLPCCLSLQQPA